MNSISVLIPNYNGKELLEEIIPSIKEALLPIESSEIIVIDDCSSDDSVAFLEATYPEIILLKGEKNKGFSSSVNKGIYHASKDLVFILNSDAKLFPDYFKYQLVYFEKEDTFGVNGTIINWDNDQVQAGGKILRFNALKIKSNVNYYLTDVDEERWYSTMFLSGTNMLLDRKKSLMINGLDQLFDPFYVEDIEFSLRALRMGWKLYYEPKSICRHQISKTIQSHHRRKYIQFLNIRNKYYMHCIHLSSIDLAGWFALTITTSFLRIFIGNISYIKAFLALIRNYKGVIRSRQVFYNTAKVYTGDQTKDTREVLTQLKREILSYPIDKEFY